MPQQNQSKDPTQTIVITNLGGVLTRVVNGDLNSGKAKYSTSFGYDPFSFPGNLTWLEQPVDVDPTAQSIKGLITAAKSRIEGTPGTGNLYAVDHLGNIYNIIPNNSLNSALITSASIVAAAAGAGQSYTYGGGAELWGDSTYGNQQLYFGGDGGVERMSVGGGSVSGRVSVPGTGVNSPSSFIGFIPRPLVPFAGNLIFGNGANIGTISTASIASSNQQLSPPLPPGMVIRDMQESADFNYLLILASFVYPTAITAPLGDRAVSNSGDSAIFQWNGTDVGVTAGVHFPTFSGTSIHAYLDRQLYTSMDSLGANIIDGVTKKVSLPNAKPPSANANNANGNMFTIATVEKFNGSLQASLFYYGQFDDETPPGLYRLFSIGSTQTNGWIESVPWQILYGGNQPTTDNASSVLATIEGKHIFSALDVSNGAGTSKFKLYTFALPATGTGTPNLGVYETQTQLFSKKITVKQIRVYTEPTVANNGFQVDCIGSDGKVITNSNTNTYAFSAGTDITKLQGSLERIDFNPAQRDTYALGIRITNTGTVNMDIHKVEIDVVPSGK